MQLSGVNISSEPKGRKEYLPCFAVAPPGASKMAQAEMNVAKTPAQSASCRESTVDFRVS